MFRRHLRRARFLWLSVPQWRKRGVFWAGAVLIGIVAAEFALAADYCQHMFQSVLHRWPYAPLLMTPLAFALSGWFSLRFFPNSGGSGIPQAIAARSVDDPGLRQSLLGPRLIFGKIALTLLGLLGGASIGREGPTVQVGAAILLLAAGLGRLRGQRGLVLAGSAAGVAAAFNTPLAGIVFAIEEMARQFETRTNGLVLITIVLSGISSMAILGNYDYFGHASVPIRLGRDWLACGVIGIVGGLAGSLFAFILVRESVRLRRLCNGWGDRHPILFIAACGVLAAALGIACGGATFGTGYDTAKTSLLGQAEMPWWYGMAKFASTSLAAVSGIPGGIFAPSLSIGAGIGGAFAHLFTEVPPQVLILMGMVGYFAGVTQAPITAFVIVLEMTGRDSMVVPLIAVAFIAATVGRWLRPVSLYHAMAEGYHERVLHAASQPRPAGQT